jgi:membrane associated rhomboid family serine protease
VNDFGKMLILLGAVIMVVGAVIVLSGRAHLPIGRLPGDVVYRGKHSTVYFPIVTCIVISLILTLVFWVLGRFGR